MLPIPFVPSKTPFWLPVPGPSGPAAAIAGLAKNKVKKTSCSDSKEASQLLMSKTMEERTKTSTKGSKELSDPHSSSLFLEDSAKVVVVFGDVKECLFYKAVPAKIVVILVSKE